jgi:uncharacterized protein DUF1761
MVNWLAVAACVVFSMVSGSLWFSPRTFFPVWWKAIGKEDEKPKNTPLTWVLIVVSSLVQALGMTSVISLVATVMESMVGGVNELTAVNGAVIGFLMWLGFVAPTGLANKLFAGQYKAWFLEQGNHLINFLVFGVILAAWR